MRKLKKNGTTILLVLIFLVGLSLLLYPSVSDYWNSFHQSRAIASYTDQVEEMALVQYDRIWEAAKRYNRGLSKKRSRWVMDEKEQKEYESLLNVGGTGIMGYVEIPKIQVSLPIYHGSDEGILQVAIGHIEGSSLPVGGAGTHCVISGHRGLPSAKLFTNLDQLTEGDIFMLRVLNELLTYEVDRISVVEPDDVSELRLEPGADLCTLVTCTPYGVNSHRLLVRGHRIENAGLTDMQGVSEDAAQVEPVRVALAVAAVLLALQMMGRRICDRRRRGRKKQKSAETEGRRRGTEKVGGNRRKRRGQKCGEKVSGREE